MSLGPYEPLIYIAGQGALVGLVIGFMIRKLNKAIAATMGLLIIAINVFWFLRMLEIPINLPAIDPILDLLPVQPADIVDQYGGMMPAVSSLPFIGGAIVGLWIGFKIA